MAARRRGEQMRRALAAALVAGFVLTSALDNGVGRTPAMGFNTWNSFRCDINEQLIRSVADALVSTGLAGAGYTYVVIDDCWMEKRDAETGEIVPFESKFPSGMRALGDYIHSKGLRFGIYSNAGRRTCEGYPGGWEHEEVDARTYASWGVDYLKYDFCDTTGLPGTPREIYARMAGALNRTGRPVLFSLCNWGVGEPHEWGAALGHSWRTGRDVFAAWDEEQVRALRLPTYLQSVLSAVDGILNRPAIARAAGPGGFNDPDMLVVGLDDGMYAYGIVSPSVGCPEHVAGCTPGEYISRERWGKVGGLSRLEQRTHFEMWCFLAAPLMLGNDPRRLTQAHRSLLTSPELLAISQDPLAAPAVRVLRQEATASVFTHARGAQGSTEVEVWTRPLSGGRVAALVLNRGGSIARAVSVDFARDLPTELTAPWRRQLELLEVCVDSHAHPEACVDWAKHGECEKNPGFMANACARSCEKCRPLAEPSVELVSARVRDASARDDLGVWTGMWTAHNLEPHAARVVVLRFVEPPVRTLREPGRLPAAAGDDALGSGDGRLDAAAAAAAGQTAALEGGADTAEPAEPTPRGAGADSARGRADEHAVLARLRRASRQGAPAGVVPSALVPVSTRGVRELACGCTAELLVSVLCLNTVLVLAVLTYAYRCGAGRISSGGHHHHASRGSARMPVVPTTAQQQQQQQQQQRGRAHVVTVALPGPGGRLGSSTAHTHQS